MTVHFAWAVHEELETLLDGSGHLQTLAFLYASKGMSSKALAIWRILARNYSSGLWKDPAVENGIHDGSACLTSGRETAATEASKILEDSSDQDLVLQHLAWVCSDCRHKPNTCSLSFDIRRKNKSAFTRYLQWLIEDQDSDDTRFHTFYALSLAKSAIETFDSERSTQRPDAGMQEQVKTIDIQRDSIFQSPVRERLQIFFTVFRFLTMLAEFLKLFSPTRTPRLTGYSIQKIGTRDIGAPNLGPWSVRKLEDSGAAEQYCAEIGLLDAYMRLLDMYLDPRDGKEPMFKAAVCLLHNHGESLDPLQVLETLSPDMPLQLASDTILRMLGVQLHHHRQGQIVHYSSRAVHIDARLARLEERSRLVQINDESLCDSCHACRNQAFLPCIRMIQLFVTRLYCLFENCICFICGVSVAKASQLLSPAVILSKMSYSNQVGWLAAKKHEDNVLGGYEEIKSCSFYRELSFVSGIVVLGDICIYMVGMLRGDSSHHSTSDSGPSRNSQEKQEEVGRWYFSRKEIEENFPSRMDGIDLKKETYLRKSYCTFLQDLGMRLKVPQVTIATAIIFCHRFFIRQSHAKNDRRTIATVCMFLAGKVEETPRPLKDVILVSYEIIHKKDPAAAQRIKQKEVYEQQKELILLGERVVLATLGFDLNVLHPYKPLVEAIKKFKVAQNALAQVAWNFVNDGLRTSLCLQFKPHHIAAGAIFLAAKFLKVKLPSDGEKVWWQEFDVTPRQLEEVSNQMLELYEQNRLPPPQGSEVEGSAVGGTSHRTPAKHPSGSEEKQISSRSAADHSSADNHGMPSRTARIQSNDNGSGEMDSVITDHKMDIETKDNQHPEQLPQKENMREASNKSRSGMERTGGEDQERDDGRNEIAETGEWRDDGASRKASIVVGRNLDIREGPVGRSPKDAIKIDKDKLKAALEKRRKSRGETMKKMDVMDEDDLIERELEDGVELAVEDEKIKREHQQSWSRNENQDHVKDHGEMVAGNHFVIKGQSYRGFETEAAEEGEMLDDASPMVNSRKRKGRSPPDRQLEGKKRHEYMSSYIHDTVEDGQKMGRSSYVDKEHRRHLQENHL
ncbi:hypothetical protein CRYUN_Cryun31cG0060000 [Craigia yunnanensis]